MEWKYLQIIEITENWQLITSDAEIFRVTHLSVPIEKDYIKAVIAQASQENDYYI
jgi:translation elongation factor EF-Tu-like GTPase